MPSTDFDTPLPDHSEDLLHAFGEAAEEQEHYKKPSSSIVVGELMENLYWSNGESDDGPAPLGLSTNGNTTITSQTLTELSPGEYFVFKFQVDKFYRESDCAPAIQFLLEAEEVVSGFVCSFPPGMDFLLGGGLYLNDKYYPLDLDFPTYLPGEINTVVLAFDGEAKTIQLILNGEPLSNWIIAENLASRKLKVRVTGLQVKVWG